MHVRTSVNLHPSGNKDFTKTVCMCKISGLPQGVPCIFTTDYNRLFFLQNIDCKGILVVCMYILGTLLSLSKKLKFSPISAVLNYIVHVIANLILYY